MSTVSTNRPAKPAGEPFVGAELAPPKRNNRRRRVNVPLLLASIVVAAVAGVGIYFLHDWRQAQVVRELVDRAEAAMAANDWSQAASYLQRYVVSNPTDFAARRQLIDTTHKSIRGPADRLRLTALIYNTVGMAPDKQVEVELRQMLVENLVESRYFAEAYERAAELLDLEEERGASSSEAARAARRAKAFSQCVLYRGLESRAGSQAEQDNVVLLRDKNAKDDIIRYLEDVSDDLQVAPLGADFFRRHPQLTPEGAEPAAFADQFINRLIEALPKSADALVSRYVYRKVYGLPEAAGDLKSALELEPNHFEANLYSARESLTTDSAAARKHIEQAIASSPKDPRGYAALARFQLASERGDHAAIEKTLRDGMAAVGEYDVNLGQLLTAVLIDAKKLPEAKAALADFQSNVRRSADPTLRAARENQANLLEAQYLIAANEPAPAAEKLSAILAITDKGAVTAASAERIQAKRLLAAVLERLGNWDQAAENWAELADSRVAGRDADLYAGRCHLQLRQWERAIAFLDRYLDSSADPSQGTEFKADPAAWPLLLQAHLQLQQSLPVKNYSEFLLALEEAKQKSPGRLEVLFAEIEYLNLSGADGAADEIKELLRGAESVFADDRAYWSSAAMAYLVIGEQEAAEQALARYDAIEDSAVRELVVRVAYLGQAKRFAEIERLLSDSIKTASPRDRRALQLIQLQFLLSQRRVGEAKDLIATLLKDAPNDRSLLVAGVEAATQANDDATAKKWEDALAQRPGDKNPWRHARSQRLLAKFSSLAANEKAELGRLISEIRSSRPKWHVGALLAGRFAELSGNRQQAIQNYELAKSLGDVTPLASERLGVLLYAEGRYLDAQKHLESVALVSDSAQLEYLRISAAMQSDPKKAVELAERSLQSHPDEPLRHVWLADSLAASGKAEDVEQAEQRLRKSVEQFPKDMSVHGALFALLVRTQQADKARLALEDLKARAEGEPFKKHFALAQGFQLLGDSDQALQECKAAVGANPQDVPARLLLGRLYLSSDTVQARNEFEQVLKLDRTNGEARRHLATLLAASGSDDEWARALELVSNEATDAAADAAASNRIRAILLARRGKTRQERIGNITAARKILQEQVANAGVAAEDLDRSLLAKLCEDEGWLSSDYTLLSTAREQLTQLVDRPEAPLGYGFQYVEFLTRQINKLAGADPTETAANDLRDVFLQDAEARLAELKLKFGSTPTAANALQLASCSSRLANAVTPNTEPSTAALDALVDERLSAIKSELGDARTYLAIGNLYSSIQAHEQAEQWYRKLLELAPQSFVFLVRELAAQGKISDAVNICLQQAPAADRNSPTTAAVLAQVVTSAKDSSIEQQVNPVLDAALASHGDNVELLMAVAVLNVTRENNDEAIRLLRRVIELAPTNALALNNLATLLAERPADVAEALELINRCIEVSGRQPAVLDTLGTIQMRAGRYQEAVASLREATAGEASDPRHYFHLAAACQGANLTQEAADALKHSIEQGLLKTILTKADRELLEKLQKELQLPAASASRAIKPHVRGIRNDASSAIAAHAA